MSDQPVTIVSFDVPERASGLQGALSDSSHPCELVSCEQWLGSAARKGRSALLFYFGRGMPTPHDVDRMRRMASGQDWRAIFEGERPTKLPRSLLLPPRYFLWPEDREELVEWLDHPDGGSGASAPERVGLIGRSPVFLAAFAQLRRFAPCAAPMIIRGESGTGKQAAAHAAHRLAGGEDRSFRALYCGTLSEGLAELEAAGPQAGTLFFDNLEDLPPRTQVNLLGWLQSRPDLTGKGGGQGPRVIATTGAPAAAADSGIRPDLLGRLSVLDLHLPPLRDRDGDVDLLAQHFAARFAPSGRSMSDGFRKALRDYHWPGNVRELENFMHRACVLSARGMLQLREAGLPGAGQTGDAPGGIPPYHAAREATLRAFETDYLRRLMRASDGNVTWAAGLAGIERRSLGRMLKRNRMCASPDANGEP
jgi:DNA-binding NtrC family response regulator